VGGITSHVRIFGGVLTARTHVSFTGGGGYERDSSSSGGKDLVIGMGAGIVPKVLRQI